LHENLLKDSLPHLVKEEPMNDPVEAAAWWLSWIETGKFVALFLVAIGVAGEFLGDWIAKPLERKIEAARQLELAQLKNRTAEAELELVKLKTKTAPRTLLESQRLAMLPLLEPLRGQPIAFACRMMDGESCDYTNDLVHFFLDAGCQAPPPIKTSVNDLPGYIAITLHGTADATVAQTLLNIFKAADIPAKIETIPENSISSWYTNVVHVVVGRKTP
jgi:hypothetical protein